MLNTSMEDRILSRLLARSLKISSIMPEMLTEVLAVPAIKIPDSIADSISAQMNVCSLFLEADRQRFNIFRMGEGRSRGVYGKLCLSAL